MPLLEQPESQRTETRTDLDHGFARLQFRGRDDLANRVRVVHKVLSPLLGRRHVEPLGEGANLGRAKERHHVP